MKVIVRNFEFKGDMQATITLKTNNNKYVTTFYKVEDVTYDMDNNEVNFFTNNRFQALHQIVEFKVEEDC